MLTKNRTLKIMLGTGLSFIGIFIALLTIPTMMFFPLLIVGVVLMVISLLIILTGFPKILFVVGTGLGILGLILAYFGDPDYEYMAGILIGLGILVGCIGIFAGYPTIKDVTEWDKDI